jgi:SHS2 domain-containing protein
VNPFDVTIHPRYVTLISRGTTMEDVFINAALALGSCVMNPATVSRGGFRDRIQAGAHNQEALLAAWLDQLFFLFSVQQEALCFFEIQSLTETAIEAEGEGELLDPGRHELRQTLAGVGSKKVEIRKTAEGFEAEVIFYKS